MLVIRIVGVLYYNWISSYLDLARSGLVSCYSIISFDDWMFGFMPKLFNLDFGFDVSGCKHRIWDPDIRFGLYLLVIHSFGDLFSALVNISFMHWAQILVTRMLVNGIIYYHVFPICCFSLLC